MASREYLKFQSDVKLNGGRITVAPSGKAAAAYASDVWVTKSNARLWPLPNEYSANGQTGYYHVPAAIAAEIAKFKTATDAESKQAGTQLMEQWGIPKALQSLGNFSGTLKSVALIVLVVGGIVYVVSRRR